MIKKVALIRSLIKDYSNDGSFFCGLLFKPFVNIEWTFVHNAAANIHFKYQMDIHTTQANKSY